MVAPESMTFMGVETVSNVGGRAPRLLYIRSAASVTNTREARRIGPAPRRSTEGLTPAELESATYLTGPCAYTLSFLSLDSRVGPSHARAFRRLVAVCQ
jgi:hypothetical protein